MTAGAAPLGARRERARAKGLGPYMREARAATLLDANPLAGLSLLLLLATFAAGGYWADHAVLDVVTVGQGKVIPSQREQVIQSLDGGILAALKVAEGDVVERGQVLLRLDDTRAGAVLAESESTRNALRAAIARLKAEADGVRPVFAGDLTKAAVALERNLYRSRRRALEQAVASLASSLKYADEELQMTAPLVKKGVVSEVDVLRLRRQVNELKAKIRDRRNAFRADARAKLAEKEAALAAIEQKIAARADQVHRAVIRSPVRGTVKRISLTTLGGVVRPGERIMEIVPLDDQLLIEARVKPRDVAFLHPGLPATVKITAYDFSIYGGLEGTLEHISADTIADQRDPRQRYYRVRVRTTSSQLKSKRGPLRIIPGMIATVEILTGHKTVLDYILKPVLKAKQNALRER